MSNKEFDDIGITTLLEDKSHKTNFINEINKHPWSYYLAFLGLGLLNNFGYVLICKFLIKSIGFLRFS
jgi:hypothetical protein